MKKYYWPLVLIGGTVLVIGAALPWFTYCGGLVRIGEPYCGSVTGGPLPVLGGAILMIVALMENGEPGSPSFALILSVLSGLFVASIGFFQLTAVVGDAGTYSTAFGFGTSSIGAVLDVIGSLMRAPGNLSMNEPDVVILAALDLFIVCAGLALIAYPFLGDWLGLWHTVLPGCSFLCGVHEPVPDCSSLRASCYATATAKAIQLTPPARWP